MNILKRISDLEGELTELRSRVILGEVEQPGSESLMVRFELREHHFGVMLHDVETVVRMVAVEPLPDAPPRVAGLLNLRGELVPVLETGLVLLGEAVARRLGHQIIVVRCLGRQIGLIVDRVLGLEPFEGTLISKRAIGDLAIDGEALQHLHGALQRDADTVLLVDAQTLITDEQSQKLDDMLDPFQEIPDPFDV